MSQTIQCYWRYTDTPSWVPHPNLWVAHHVTDETEAIEQTRQHAAERRPGVQIEIVRIVYTSGCYILRFSKPMGSDKHTARYYIGWSNNVPERVKAHQRGKGSAITRAAVKQGIRLELVLFIPGATRDTEKQIKRAKNTARFLARLEQENGAAR